MVMQRHGGFGWFSIFVASIAVLGAAQLSFAEDETPGQVGEQVAVEGTFIRVAANEEGWVTVAYRTANEAVGEEYMLLRVGMTLIDDTGTQTITRDDIKLVTPDNKVLPLMTQEEAEKASGHFAMLTKRAAMDTDSVRRSDTSTRTSTMRTPGARSPRRF